MTVDISVIVPVYNEEDSVPLLFDKVVEALEPLGQTFEVVFVDDGSTDGSFARLEQMHAADPRAGVLKFRKNAGQTAAMAAGIRYARGKILVTMDGDLQNDPADIPMMLAKIDEGYDLVIGWRMKRKDAFITRKLPSKVANWLIGRITGLPVRDNGCSLKVYRASMIKRVPLYSDMHRLIPAMTVPLGARIVEVGVRHHARQFGESKYGLSRIFKVFFDLISAKTLLLFARQPLRRFSGLAAIFAIFAIIWIVTAVSGVGNAGRMMHTAVATLLGSTAIFLALLGAVATLAHRNTARVLKH